MLEKTFLHNILFRNKSILRLKNRLITELCNKYKYLDKQ